jgi:hypothetical protein
MRKKLEQMEVDLRQLMTYESPPELGGLYSEVFSMMEKITGEQTIAIQKKMQKEHASKIRRRKRIELLYMEIALGISGLLFAAAVGLLFAYVVEDRIEKYPQYGEQWIPKTEERRRQEALPKVYIGR